MFNNQKITWPSQWYNDLQILPEGMKTDKVKKTCSQLHDKEEYVIHKRSL